MPPRSRLALAWTALILALCWLPGPAMPVSESSWTLKVPNFDKIIHFGLFAVFAVLWMRVGRRGRRAAWVLAAGFLLAVVTEVGQSLPIVHRDGNVMDGLADGLGVLAGVVASLAGQPGARLGMLALGWLGIVAGPALAEDPRPGQRLERRGDEIVACGQLFHTTAPVVLWTDPGGYDAYRVERRFAPFDASSWAASQGGALRTPNRYGVRTAGLSDEARERVRGGGWDLPSLREVVDQFVIHFDARGTSRGCFEVLHDRRGLSVHFLLDLDGTIYQTLDLKERAFHATIANGRSVGVEIANIGAYPTDNDGVLARWYARDADGRTRVVLSPSDRDAIRDRRASLRPIRDEPVVGTIQGRELRQYDLTPEQYDSLIKLTAALGAIFPKIRLDYPRDASGALITHKLTDDDLGRYRGLLGHYHVQTNKVDPGPAFQWDRVVDGARRLLAE